MLPSFQNKSEFFFGVGILLSLLTACSGNFGSLGVGQRGFIATGTDGQSVALEWLLGTPNPSISACTPVAVQLANGAQGIASAPADLSVALSASGSGAFYSDFACQAAIDSVKIAKGSAGASLYFTDPAAESVTLSAASPGLAVSQSQLSMFSGNKLAFVGAPQSVADSDCIAFQVQSQSVSGTPLPVAADTVISLSGASSGAFNTSNCSLEDGVLNGSQPVTSVTIPAGNSATIIYFQDPVPETVTLAASTGGYASASIRLGVVPGAAAKIIISGPSTVKVGTCAAYSVLLETTAGSPSAASADMIVQAYVQSFASSFSFYSDSNCLNAFNGNFTIPQGQGQGTFYLKPLQIVLSNVYLMVSTAVLSASSTLNITML